MIDFRYHVVSIVAVFLALALGLVLGSTALRGPVLNNLSGNVKGLTDDNKTLRNQVRDAEALTSKDGDFVDAAAPKLIGGSLIGSRVAVVSLPGADGDQVDAIGKYVKAAGAGTPSTLRISDGFFDPKRGAEIKDLVAQLLPAGVTTPPTDDGVAQGASLLGAVLAGKQKKTTISSATRSSVLGGFSNLGLLNVDGSFDNSVDHLIVVGAETDTSDGAKKTLDSEVTAVQQLDSMLPRCVVVAPSGSPTIVTGIRKDTDLAKKISTVDNSDAVVGRLNAILALVAEDKGTVGAYGTSGGTSPVPSVALR